MCPAIDVLLLCMKFLLQHIFLLGVTIALIICTQQFPNYIKKAQAGCANVVILMECGC